MKYLKIEKEDVSNGEGLRVVLWVSGCSVGCKNCQNPQAWDKNSGIIFDNKAKEEILKELAKDSVSGLTLTGGHPLENYNVETIYLLVKEIKDKFPQKTIWLYTGYTWEQIFPKVITNDFEVNRVYRQKIVEMCDVLVEGPYIKEQKDITLAWRGSKNQRVIDIQKTLKTADKNIVLFCE